MILCKVVEYYVFFICAKSRHCSWKSTRDIFVYVCFSVFVHVNCATDQMKWGETGGYRHMKDNINAELPPWR